MDAITLQETGDFTQKDGKVAFFLPGEIHNTLNVTGDRAVVVRLESQKLDRITRYQYNPDEGTMVVMDR